MRSGGYGVLLSVLGNVVSTFAIILAIYLVATSFGSALISVGFSSHKLLEGRRCLILLYCLARSLNWSVGPELAYTASAQEAGFVLGAIRVVIGSAPLATAGLPDADDEPTTGLRETPDALERYSYNAPRLDLKRVRFLTGFWLLARMSTAWVACILSAPLFFMGLIR